jgi:predicted permease
VGRTFEPGKFPVAQTRWVSPDYWRTMGIPLTLGRYLRENDRNQPVTVISESLARRFFPGQQAVGQQLLFDVMTPKPSAVEIVGVVGDTRDWALDVTPEPTVCSLAVSPTMVVMIRTASDPGSLAPAIRRMAMSTNPALGVDRVRFMDQLVENSLAQRRFALLLVGGFAALALVLATIGIYGVVSYSIATRTRELGLRIALGAQRRDVIVLVFRESFAKVAPGLAAGCVLAFAWTHIMATLLYNVTATDPLTYCTAALFLMAVAMLAVYLPAHRATRIDPMGALREQ